MTESWCTVRVCFFSNRLLPLGMVKPTILQQLRAASLPVLDLNWITQTEKASRTKLFCFALMVTWL